MHGQALQQTKRCKAEMMLRRAGRHACAPGHTHEHLCAAINTGRAAHTPPAGWHPPLKHESRSRGVFLAAVARLKDLMPWGTKCAQVSVCTVKYGHRQVWSQASEVMACCLAPFTVLVTDFCLQGHSKCTDEQVREVTACCQAPFTALVTDFGIKEHGRCTFECVQRQVWSQVSKVIACCLALFLVLVREALQQEHKHMHMNKNAQKRVGKKKATKTPASSTLSSHTHTHTQTHTHTHKGHRVLII
eukprot:1161969-Pelagomonas_calceolata.AAC.8